LSGAKDAKAQRLLEAQREEKLNRVWRDLISSCTPANAIYWLKHPVPVLENRRDRWT